MAVAVSKTFPLIGSAKASDLKVTKRGDHSLVYQAKPAPTMSEKTSFDLYAERFANTAVNSPRVNMSGSENFAQKFRSRPSTRVPIVRPQVTNSGAGKRGVEGFFPCIKVQGTGRLNTTARTLVPAPATNFEIAPSTAHTNHFYRSQTTSVDRTSPHLRQAKSQCSRQCFYYIHPYPNMVPDVDEIPPIGGDLSYLPRPLKLAPRRELPFVYRHKVKRNMNVLFKIMASKRNATDDLMDMTPSPT